MLIIKQYCQFIFWEVDVVETNIRLPERVRLDDLMNSARKIKSTPPGGVVNIDFVDRNFFSPFEILFTSSVIKQACSSISVNFKNEERYPYLHDMGFFDMCRSDGDAEIGRDGENFISIRNIKRENLYQNPADSIEEMQDLVQRYANKISEMISKERCGDLYDALSYSIREVMRNVFEHSQSSSLYFCAQYWTKSKKVEFSISDFGVGIRRSLSENPNFRFKSDKDAIEHSLLPSVSGKTHLPRRSDIWHNSGYGLYMLERLARSGGNFVIASGKSAIHLSRNQKNNFITDFDGTIIRFNLDIEKISDVKNLLNRFREEGYDIAKKISGSGNRPPSAMSMLIRKDY
jgi:hypothetical protein